MKPDISIIIVTSKISKHLKNCIDSIYKFTTSPYEIIIVYTGPTNKNTDELQTFPNSKYLPCHKKNTGFAYNRGIKQSKADNIIILSPKVTVTPNWDVAMLNCSQIVPSIGLVGKSKKSTTHPTKDITEIQIAESLDESCLLIKRIVIDSIGDFDEQFSSTTFLFDDFFLRARFDGFELSYCNEDYAVDAYDSHILDNIDYLDIYLEDRNKFIDKWKTYLPIKNDLISEILNKLPTEGSGDILFLGDIPIIPNVLTKRGYTVKSLPRSAGYHILLDKSKLYNIIILFDNITHEQTLIKLLEEGSSVLKPRGLIVANIHNSLFIERVQHIFKGNFSIASFDSNLKYPICCLSKPEIIASGEVAALELMYLVGFATKPTPNFQKLFKEICNTNPGSRSFKEELCIEEYLVVWQKGQFRD